MNWSSLNWELPLWYVKYVKSTVGHIDRKQLKLLKKVKARKCGRVWVLGPHYNCAGWASSVQAASKPASELGSQSLKIHKQARAKLNDAWGGPKVPKYPKVLSTRRGCCPSTLRGRTGHPRVQAASLSKNLGQGQDPRKEAQCCHPPEAQGLDTYRCHVSSAFESSYKFYSITDHMFSLIMFLRFSILWKGCWKNRSRCAVWTCLPIQTDTHGAGWV